MPLESQERAGKASESLKLTPRLHPAVGRLLECRSTLFDLTKALGSPLNIILPELVRQNLESFQDVFDKHGIKGRILFAHKSNQSDSIVRQLSLLDAGLDVSSTNELRHALASGFRGERLEATGPKSLDFIALGLQHGITFSIDSLAELASIIALRRQVKPPAPTKVLVRLCGFEAEHSRFLNKGSRFGIPVARLPDVFSLIDDNRGDLQLSGFAFHLDTVSVIERAVAIENCFQIFEEAMSRGFDPYVLNIGGGYKVNYLACEKDWNDYTHAIKESVLGERKQITWQGTAFGLSADKGKLRGFLNSYNYYDPLAGGRFLDELLCHQFANLGERTAASVLRDNMIELWIEPGRSLVDQCGVTLARVNYTRQSSRGDEIVCLAMKRQDISFLDQEIFVDPVVIYADGPAAAGDREVPVYFAGNLCLESDLIYRHQTFLARLPQPGDLVAFVNTAGYFQDFSATSAIMQPIARKVAVVERGDGFVWTLDSEYSPFENPGGL